MLSELRNKNSEHLESERVSRVMERAHAFYSGYVAAGIIFKQPDRCYIKHLAGVTEIVANYQMSNLSRLRVFSKSGGTYRHLYLPITISGFDGGFHTQIKVNVYWGCNHERRKNKSSRR